MTQYLGVDISLPKSIKAVHSLTLEFAKKFYHHGTRVKIVPPRDIIATQLSTMAMQEFRKKYSQSFLDYLSLRSIGYKAKSRHEAPLYRMSNRMRVYTVLRLYDEIPFLK